MVFNPTVVRRDDSGWGPPPESVLDPEIEEKLKKYPFEVAVVKQDKFSVSACDFTYLSHQRAQKDGRAQEERSEFRLVDSRPVKSQQPRKFIHRRPWNRGGMQGGQGHGIHAGRGRGMHQPHRGGGRGWGNNPWYGGMQQRNWARQHAEWSIDPSPSWQMLHEIQLAKLGKAKLDVKQIVFEDVGWSGELYTYQNPQCPPPVTLRDHRKDREFYIPGTMSDETLTSFFQEMPNVGVAATDQILACLMSAPQSRSSWYLKVTKIDQKLLFDKADGSSLDVMTVGETAKEMIFNDNKVLINRPNELSMEALRINQDFQQQVLDMTSKPPIMVCGRASFVPPDENPAKKLYRYRLITLPPSKPGGGADFSSRPVTIATRVEIDGKLPGAAGATSGLLTIRAFNEYDYKSTRTWRDLMEKEKGALFATESKNNACKLAKWVSTAIIGGCEQLKVGFVTRTTPTINQGHQILFVSSFTTEELANQLNMTTEVVWSSVRSVLDILGNLSDGSYMLLKDPLKPILRVYRTPDDDEIGANAAEGLNTQDKEKT